MINYFEFFGIDQAFFIDEDALRKNFIANSRKYHPDFHTLSNDTQQDEVLELSTINNDGYNVLKDPFRRMQHLLSLEGKMPEEGQATVPQDFLMEMMEINEALMELEFDENYSKQASVIQSIKDMEDALSKDGEMAMLAWDKDHEDAFLDQVVEYFLKMKYIKRLKEQLIS